MRDCQWQNQARNQAGGDNAQITNFAQNRCKCQKSEAGLCDKILDLLKFPLRYAPCKNSHFDCITHSSSIVNAQFISQLYDASATNRKATWARFFEGTLALNPGFFFLSSKAFSGIIFSVIFRTPNHQLVDRKN